MSPLTTSLPYLLAGVVALICVGFTVVIAVTRDNSP